MRKLILIITVFLLILSITACSNNEETIELTWPSSFFEGDAHSFREDEFIKQNPGVVSAKINSDNSITFTMLEDEFLELKSLAKEELVINLDNALMAHTNTYIDSYDYSEDFRNINLYINLEDYDNSDDMTPILIGLTTLSYHNIVGNPPETEIRLIDKESNEVIDTLFFPDDYTG
jgi:hypothetical protein